MPKSLVPSKTGGIIMALFDENIQFHLKIKKGDIGRYVILPGDPKRAGEIAKYLDNAEKISQNREYTVYTGFLNGEKVSVCSTGIGGPSAAIAAEELIKCGADALLRVGTSGGINTKVRGGDLVIATSAVRAEGTSKEYLPEGYPAAASYEVVHALHKSASVLLRNLDSSYHIGVVQSKDSFYGETNPETMPVEDMLTQKWSAYVRCGCLASEMECASIFSVATVRNVRAGAVLTAIWNVERTNNGLDDSVCLSSENAIKCAIGAIKILIERDRQKLEGAKISGASIEGAKIESAKIEGGK